jgi:NifU-like protein involved in Fe-S cluster formation
LYTMSLVACGMSTVSKNSMSKHIPGLQIYQTLNIARRVCSSPNIKAGLWDVS